VPDRPQQYRPAKPAGAAYHPDPRPNAHRRGYTRDWQKARLRFLAAHPLCSECEKDGRVEPATVVDHNTPHKGDPGLFWNESNWSPLCGRHHNIKTATRDGGFGRPPKDQT
jgi:5-methylcytosine-specific restriction protein A